MKDPEVQAVLTRVRDAVAHALRSDSETVEFTTDDARWLLANLIPPCEDEPPLTVPFAVLVRYPMSLVTTVTALWEVYMRQLPAGQLKLTTPVEPLLIRLGKDYSEEPLRELDRVLHDLYRLQKIGYQRVYRDGVDTLIVWLTPDVVKRARAYKESLRPHA